MWRRRRKSASGWPNAPKPRASTEWYSIAAAIFIMAVSRRWPMRPAKRGWSFNASRTGVVMPAVTVKRVDPQSLNLKENVVAINRVTKVVKGGKNMSFSALVVVGDSSARVVGFGVGKAKEVPSAIRKGIEAAKKNLRKVHLLENTIPHQVLGRFGAGMVMLKPAQDGTGVIAGGPVRAVVQACGIPNVLTKSIGSHNPHNVVKATINALEQLRDKNAVMEMRGLNAEKM